MPVHKASQGVVPDFASAKHCRKNRIHVKQNLTNFSSKPGFVTKVNGKLGGGPLTEQKPPAKIAPAIAEPRIASERLFFCRAIDRDGNGDTMTTDGPWVAQAWFGTP